MFESPASALAFFFGIVAIGLNFLEFNLFRLGGTVILVVFLLYQISCLDLGDCDFLSYAHALIPIVLSGYLVYNYYINKEKKDKGKKDKGKKENKN